MVKVTLQNNVKRVGPVIKNPDVTTIRSLLQENGFDDSGSTIWNLNGTVLAASDFDMTLSEFGATTVAQITAITKAQNANA